MSDSEKPPISQTLGQSIHPALKTQKAKVVGIFTIVLTLLGAFAEYWPTLQDVLDVFCQAAGRNCQKKGEP